MVAPKTLDIYNAIVDILRIFADTEIGGQYEINNAAVADYLNSFACSAHFFDENDKEAIYQKFTEDILNGYPVYKMLILPEWTMKMVKNLFERERQEEYAEACNKYKCLTCKYLSEKYINTIGETAYQCFYREEDKSAEHTTKRTGGRERRRQKPDFLNEFKTECEHYDKRV